METGISRVDVEVLHLAEEIGMKVREIDIRQIFDNFVDSTNDQIKKTEEALNDLQDTIDDAFADGIISQAEAAAIERSKTNLMLQKSELDAKYIIIYSNKYLDGDMKVTLLNSKTEFDLAHSHLLNTIDEAIVDSKITPTEKQKVDDAFAGYNTKLADFSGVIQTALDNIQQNMIDAIEIGARNLLLNSNVVLVKPEGDEGGEFGHYLTSKMIVPGKDYTFVWQAATTANQGISASAESKEIDVIKDRTITTHSLVFRNIKNTNAIKFSHNPAVNNEAVSTVYWAMLFEGNVKAPKDWIPAPEDTESLVRDMEAQLREYSDAATEALNTKIELGDKALNDTMNAKEAELILKTENDKRELEKKLSDQSELLTNTIDEVKGALQKETDETKQALDNLQNALDNMPTDTELTTVQLENLKYLLGSVEGEFQDINFKINVVKRDIFLPQDQLPILDDLQTENRIKFNALKTVLERALTDKILTPIEKEEIDNKLLDFRLYLDVTNSTLLDIYDMIGISQDQYLKDQIEGSIEETRLYVEYSKDGRNDWHTVFVNGDKFMRQKNGKNGNWSDSIKIVGEDGAGGIYEDFQFSSNKSMVTPPTSGWSDAPPNLGVDEYLWMRSGKVTPPATEPDVWTAVRLSGPIGPQGQKGETGLDGLQGADGKDGIPGAKGEDGRTQYTHIAYADDETGKGFSQDSTNKKFMGILVDFIQQDSQDPKLYQWSLIQGLDGSNGAPGKPGVDGKTPYFHVAYANSADGSIGFSTTDSKDKSYIGTYTDYVQKDSTNYLDYTWQKVRGEAIVSATEPPNKYVGMVWIDTSKKPIEQKYWNGTVWVLTGLSNTDVAEAIKKANDELMRTMEDALADGIISSQEAAHISNQLVLLDNNKRLLDSKFGTIYGSKSLSTASKNKLQGEKTTFDTKHKALYDFCKKISTQTNVTPAEVAEYNRLQDAYNLSLTSYSKVLEDCGQEILQNSIGGIEIGGRNLMLDTALTHVGNGAWFALPSARIIVDGYTCVQESYGWGIIYRFVKLEKGTYTISFFAKQAKNEVKARMSIQAGLSFNVFFNEIDIKDWVKCSHTFTIIEDVLDCRFYFLNDAGAKNNDEKISFRGFKLERGQYATDWTPAPEDITEEMQHIINNAAQAEILNKEAREKINFLGKPTSSANGLITGGALLVGDSTGNNAFISGVTDKGDKSVRFGAGTGGYAKKETVPFRVLNDGTLYADNAFIRGQITILPGSPAIDTIKGEIDKVQIGGTNKFSKSTKVTTTNTNSFVNLPDIYGFKLSGIQNVNNGNVRLNNVIDSNGEWTVSFEARNTQKSEASFSIDICDRGVKTFRTTNDDKFTRFIHTVNVENYSSDVYHFVDFSAYKWLRYEFKNIKVEKGNIATDFSPSPLDAIDSEIFIEYSTNGTNGWHTSMLSTDVYMRQKKGPNGTWGQAVRIAGKDGKDGTNGLQGLQGPKGDQGLSGPKGTDGKTSYTHIAYADSATGTGFSQNPANKAYIGMYVDFVAADSTTPSKYKWSLIKGANGANGTPGAKGADGKTPYLHIAWATNSTGTAGFSTTVSAGKTYIGTYTDFTQADSTTPSKYKWSLIKGADGSKGDKGDKGDKGNTGDKGATGATGAKGPQGVPGANGEPIGDGIDLFPDNDFKYGMNGCSLYGSSAKVTLTRITKADLAPTTSTHMLRVTNKGSLDNNSRTGGFVQTTGSRANAVFIHRMIIKIPVGHTIHDYQNQTGNGRTIKWLTPNKGTGKFETYMYKHHCGVGGTFSSFGHVGFKGAAGTAAAPVYYEIASSTIYDMSATDRSLDFLHTTLGTDSVATGTLLVGQGQTATAGLTGVRDSGQTSNVALWAGSTFANRKTAPMQLWTNGKLVANNATIKGNITATSGFFGGFQITAKTFQSANGSYSVDSATGMQILKDNKGRVRNKKGLDLSTGEPTDNWYDENGALVFSLTSRGTIYVNEVRESYMSQKMFFVKAATTNITQAEVITALNSMQYRQQPIDYNDEDKIYVVLVHTRTGIPTANEVIGYKYNAGRNIDSESNKQYEKYTFTGNNKLGAKIKNGWYLDSYHIPEGDYQVKTGASYADPIYGSRKILTTTSYYYTGGVITNTIVHKVSFTAATSAIDPNTGVGQETGVSFSPNVT